VCGEAAWKAAVSIDRRAFDRQLGMRLREARLALGATQEELAKALGVSAVTVARYELGERSLPVAQLPRVARLLNSSVTALLPGVEHEPAPQTELPGEALAGPAATISQLLIKHPELLPPLLDTLEHLLEQQRSASHSQP
jgi:transcriptional regulator with XRE-family HTH domain